jgi:class 3 adenylate cyclase/predicted ATPase
MTPNELLTAVVALLQREGRVSYRMLKRRFSVDDAYLEDLKEELIYAKRLAVDEDGKVLVWLGEGQVIAARTLTPLTPQAPASYTPPHLAERIRAEQVAMEARGASEGERKTITALFADIKGSMALMEDLDPEEARSIIDPVLALMMEAVHRYEGYVAQSTGDGIFAFFGAPLAHEDHSQRALFAALRMQEESRRLAEQLRVEKGLPSLQIRVGINTGEVVMRGVRKDDLHTDYTPIGHSTGLASRMEGLATPGSIVVSEHTYKLTEGYFECKPLGAVRVKGVSAPVSIYEVLGVGPLRTRLQVAARRGLVRFVGRHSEMAQLQRALEQAKAGHGQIVGVMGEPGVGKSRLFHEFKLLSLGGCLVLDAYSVSHGKASAYLPVIELLKSYFEIQPSDDERKRREKITGKVLTLDRSLEETLPYLFALLGIEEQPSPLQQMDAQIRRRRTFEALKRLFLRESLNQPLILIFEDLHWIDTETQGFLDVLSESVASARLLLLVNYRPEYRHEWGQKTYYTQLRLAPLGQAEVEELLAFLLGSDASLTPLKQMILEKTQGTPFFMEEVVQTLAEEGVLSGERGQYRLEHAPSVLHISPTVQGVLAARIDRLGAEEKALLQQLAVIGRELPLSLVRQVVSYPEEDLYGLLAALQHKEFLYEQPAFPEVEYRFKHALTQEVAYGMVLQDRRRGLHERTARAIEELYNATVEDHYGELAHHYSHSDNTQKAIDYLRRAGQQAVQRSANVEAISHLTKGLALLKTLPDTLERAQQELTLHLTLGGPLQAIRGFSSPEVKATYARARELCQQVGETRQLFPALLGLRTFHQVRGEFRTARELGEQLLSLAQREHDPALLVEAYWALGSTLCQLGEFGAARAYQEQSLTLYDAQRYSSHEFLYGLEPGVFGLGYAALVLWQLGYPDQARQQSAAAWTLAQERSYPYSLAAARGYAAMTHQLRREQPLTQEWVEAGITLAREHGFPGLLGEGAVLRGWARAEQGQSEEGISQIRQGLATYEAIGAGLFHSYYLALLAEAYGKAGQAEDGLAALGEALTVVDKSGERFYEAELYRLKGELMLQREARGWRLETSPPSPQASSLKPLVSRAVEQEAEGYFLKAIEITRQQQAKSLELRAVMSLSRLWQQQGKKKEARQLLAEVYGWFTEGFDTKDLQEAKALLDVLAA